MQEGQTFHVTYPEDDDWTDENNGPGSFIVGIVNSDGEKFLADTLLKQYGDTLSFEVPEAGKYYFYSKGLEANSGWRFVRFIFTVYFK